MTGAPATTPHKKPHAEEAPAPAPSRYATRSKDKAAAAATAAAAAATPKEEPGAPASDTHATRAKDKASSAAPVKPKDEPDVKEEEAEEAEAEAEEEPAAAEPAAAHAHKKPKTAETEEPHSLAIDRPLHATLHTSPAPGTKKAPAIIERGRIAFLFSPKVGAVDAGGVSSLADVRNFFIALAPTADSDALAREAGVDDWHARARLLVIGRKALPASTGERFWGFVDAVADSFDDLFKKKKEGEKGGGGAGGGGGEETTPEPSSPQKGGHARKAEPGEGGAPPPPPGAALRVVADGEYALTRVGHAAGTGHLTYVLGEPPGGVEPGSAQAEFGIEAAGRFVFSVKNPKGPGAPGRGLSVKALFSPDAQAAFAGKTERTAAAGLAWVNASAHPDLLATPHAEFIMIKAKPAEERDPALTTSLAEAAAEDHSERVAAMEAEAKGGGGGGPDAKAFEETLAALNEELHARALGLDVRPMVTGELE
jgi:hypothetical protein